MKNNPVPGTDHLVQAAYPELGEPFQPLLWIPEDSSNRTAFCSHNVRRYPVYPPPGPTPTARPQDIYALMGHDDNGCPRCAPFEDYTNGNCGTRYIILAITKTLTAEELDALGRAVANATGQDHTESIRALNSDFLPTIRWLLQSSELLPPLATTIDQQTESIEFHEFATACNVNVLRADFAGCTLELNLSKDHLFIIDGDGDSEEWEHTDGAWTFTSGNRGQKPTMNWPQSYYKFVEDAIQALP